MQLKIFIRKLYTESLASSVKLHIKLKLKIRITKHFGSRKSSCFLMLLSEIVELNMIKKICYRISYVKLVCFAVACMFCFVSNDCNNRKVSAEYFDATQRYVLLPSPRQQINNLSRRFSFLLLTLFCSTPLH